MRRSEVRRRGKIPRAAIVFSLLSSMVGCGGCSPSYVMRSAYEEARILLSSEPIDTLLDQKELPSDERAKLELVLSVRRFAADRLGLDVGQAYSSFAEVNPGALLWVVSAAEQTSLKPVRWWFPIVGHVTYKGFFEKSEAEEQAETLKKEGYDTFVRSSTAFSTLGWFDDPVLSSWLASSPVNLATLMIHELLHRTTYLAGQTDFNESFATFVGHRGAIEFFAERDGEDAKTTQEARTGWRDALAGSQRMGKAVDELKALYERAAQEKWPRTETLDARQVIFKRLGPPERVNNAVIVANYAYLSHLDRFECVLTENDGALRAAIEEIRKSTEDTSKPFETLASCSAEPSPASPETTGTPTQARGSGSLANDNG